MKVNIVIDVHIRGVIVILIVDCISYTAAVIIVDIIVVVATRSCIGWPLELPPIPIGI